MKKLYTTEEIVFYSCITWTVGFCTAMAVIVIQVMLS